MQTTYLPADWQTLNQTLIDCRLCPRLVEWRQAVAASPRRAYRGQEYWGRPVPGFGDPQAAVLAVGLAPGAHGSNRTGRMFTGDSSGDFLYPALHRAGFANQPLARHSQDGLELSGLFISSVCRCAPPDNKPLPQEIIACQPFLEAEISLLDRLQGYVALGGLAFEQILRFYRRQGHAVPSLPFAHAVEYELGPGLPWLIASYHPSRQNTQTGRLTEAMFDQVWQKARDRL